MFVLECDCRVLRIVLADRQNVLSIHYHHEEAAVKSAFPDAHRILGHLKLPERLLSFHQGKKHSLRSPGRLSTHFEGSFRGTISLSRCLP